MIPGKARAGAMRAGPSFLDILNNYAQSDFASAKVKFSVNALTEKGICCNIIQ